MHGESGGERERELCLEILYNGGSRASLAHRLEKGAMLICRCHPPNLGREARPCIRLQFSRDYEFSAVKLAGFGVGRLRDMGICCRG